MMHKLANSLLVKLKLYSPPLVKRLVLKMFFRTRNGLLSLSYIVNSPFLTAICWIIFSKTVVASYSSRRQTIIIFDSPGGLIDIRAAFAGADAGYKIVSLNYDVTQHLFKHFYGVNYSDYEYFEKAADRNIELAKYGDYLKGLTNHLKKLVGLKCFINFNFNYHSQRELMCAARECEVKFVTVMKECLRTDGYAQATVKGWKDLVGPVFSSAIFVHNLQTRDLIVSSGVYEQGNIVVVGQARSDELIAFREACKTKCVNKSYLNESFRILYFDISQTAGLPNFGPDYGIPPEHSRVLGSNFNWKELSQLTLNTLIDYAEDSDFVKLIVKGKPTGIYNDKGQGSKKITYIHGYPDLNMFRNVDVVVGFNTTGLFEALAAGLPTISSEIDIPKNEAITEYLYQYHGLVDVAHTAGDLVEMLDYVKTGDVSRPDSTLRDVLIDKYLGNSDGKAGLRLRQALLDHLE